jgi:hypothetical protein
MSEDSEKHYLDLLDDLYRVGYEHSGREDYDPRGTDEWEAVRSRIIRLETALETACRWGISSSGYSARLACDLRKWVDNGMIGPPLEPPEYYPT